LSRRAAWRLESLDFCRIFAYAPGKADWLAYGLPAERAEEIRLVGDFIEPEVPRCRLDDPVGEAKLSAYELGMDICAVVNAEGVVLGACSREALHGPVHVKIEEVMEPGPPTIRPSMAVEKALESLDRRKARSILVTNPDGKLMGCFSRRRLQWGETTEMRG
jgi:CBS domain-containing protein